MCQLLHGVYYCIYNIIHSHMYENRKKYILELISKN